METTESTRQKTPRTLYRLVSRRSFLHGVVVSLGMCSCRTSPVYSGPTFVKLREPVSAMKATIAKTGGSFLFEAWLSPDNDTDKLLDGIVIQTSDEFIAYSTYCPHESCVVRLERDPQSLSDVVTDGIKLPEHEVMVCGCHYSIFDPRLGGRHLGGPSPRGLYRFLVEQETDEIRVTHVEAAILDLYS